MSERNRFLQIITISLLLLVSLPVLSQIIIIHPPHRPPRPQPQPLFPGLFQLELLSSRIHATVEEVAATIVIDQEFRNPTRNEHQGTYLFPLPDGAVADRLTMWVDGREMPGEVLDAREASRMYEDIVRRSMDPALLAYDGKALLRLKIFPIRPGEKRRIRIRYHQQLRLDDNMMILTLPLQAQGLSDKTVGELSLQVDVFAKPGIRQLFSPTHPVDILQRESTQASAVFEAENMIPEQDFQLVIDRSGNTVGLSLLSYRNGDEDGYFLLNISPGFTMDAQQVLQKDITFVLDVSGSMAGDKLRQAKNALAFCIESLNSGDRFDVVRFSTQAEALFGQLSPADQENRAKAQRFVKGLRAIGGTHISDAFRLALNDDANVDRPRFTVFITDGKPTVGIIDTKPLIADIAARNGGRQRIFTIGIGDEVNTHLLDQVTEDSRGFRTYIRPNEDIEVAISSFYNKIDHPALADLSLDIAGPVEWYDRYPQTLPDLFYGGSLTVLGRYRGSGRATVTLEGKRSGKAQPFVTKAVFTGDSRRREYIPVLWAARAVGYLLDQVRRHGEDPELIREIVSLAKTYGIITPYTSYLITEDEVRRLARGENSRVQPLMPLDDAFRRRNAKSFRSSLAPSGSQSVESSIEAQDLSGSTEMTATRREDDRLDYVDARGNKQNLRRQIRQILGRAFYQNGEVWIDTQLKTQPKQFIRVAFASTAYFQFLRSNPDLATLLALGPKLRLMWKGEAYEIFVD